MELLSEVNRRIFLDHRVCSWRMFLIHCVQGREWWSYFDYILIDANKPRFFGEGSTLREIDPVNKHIKYAS